MNPVEQKILAYATELDPGLHQDQALRRLMSLDVDMDHLIDVAIGEGVAGLLYRRLMKAGALESLKDKQREALQFFYYQTVRRNLTLIYDLKETLRLLNRRNVHVVLLQGMDLLHEIYRDVGLRPMSDIDLWVLEEDYLDLIEILIGQGYRRDPIYPNTFRKGSTTFDLHKHVLWADRIKARKLLLMKSEIHIYHATRIIRIEDREALCLNPYDQVLYLSLHAIKHCVNRLIWLVDIKCLIADWSRSDWLALRERAKELGQERAILYALFLLIRLFNVRLPLEASRFLQEKRLHLLEKKILRERIKRGSLPRWAPVILFTGEMGWRGRLSFIFESLFPRPEILRQIFVDRAEFRVWQLYLMRFLQLVSRIKMPSTGF